MTNNEIIEKYGKDSKLAPDDVYSREVLLIMLNEAQVEGYKEGQTDTAKQIFMNIDINDAIEQGQLRVGGYDEWAQAEAYKILKSRINALKKEYKIED